MKKNTEKRACGNTWRKQRTDTITHEIQNETGELARGGRGKAALNNRSFRKSFRFQIAWRDLDLVSDK